MLEVKLYPHTLTAACRALLHPGQHWVIDNLDWIVTRYLLVRTTLPGQHDLRRTCNVEASAMTLPNSSLAATAVAVCVANDHVMSEGGNAAAATTETGVKRAAADGLLAMKGTGRGFGAEFDDAAPAMSDEHRILQMCAGFPDLEASAVRSVLESVGYETDQALLLLSGMSHEAAQDAEQAAAMEESTVAAAAAAAKANRPCDAQHRSAKRRRPDSLATSAQHGERTMHD